MDRLNVRIAPRGVRFAAHVPKFDTQGFESYQLNCKYCGAALVGVIDPCDGALLLSTQASSKLSDRTTAAELP